jgi:hypothetical protein
VKELLKNAKSVEEVKKLVLLDWIRAENSGGGKKDVVVFKSIFDKLTSINEVQLVPIQYESQANSAVKDYKFDVKAMTNFDDLQALDPLPQNDFEAFQYKSKS